MDGSRPVDRSRKPDDALQFRVRLANHLNDKEAALEMLGPAFEKMGAGLINHAKIDPDFAPVSAMTSRQSCALPSGASRPNPVRARDGG